MADSKTPETIFWLLRHPEPEAKASGVCYGSLDVKLAETGIRQAHAVAKTLQDVPFATICTSPRRRCTEAAKILAIGRSCAVHEMESLQELDFGDFEGRRYDEIAALYPERYREWMERPTEVQFPGGESFPQMQARVLNAFTDLRRHEGQSVAIVAHGGVTRIILADALGMAPANIFRIGQRYAAINRVRYFGEIPLVDLVNAGTSVD
jgi:alpha-ribazole phosphatase